MSKVTQTPTAHPQRDTRFSLTGFLFFALITINVAVYAILDLSKNPHATTFYGFIEYALVFPALLLFWRQNRAALEVFRPTDYRRTAIGAFAVLTAIVAFSYIRGGHTIADESSYRFQARVFASGHLKAAPMPGAADKAAYTPVELYFEHQVHDTSGWYSKYPPVWPSILALGYILRCPWLVNPVLGVLLLLLVNRAANSWGGETAMLAVPMAAFSAYTVIYSVGFLSHALAAVVGLGAMMATLRAVRANSLRWLYLGFALVVLGTEIRPFTGAVIAILCTGYAAYGFWRRGKLLIGAIATICVAGILSIAFFLLVNRVYTGNFLLSPYAYARGATKLPEFARNQNVVLQNLVHSWRWSLTDTLAFSFPFIFVAAAYACWKERQDRREAIFLALLYPALMLAHMFVSGPSASFDGERYYYEGYAPICIVGARGFQLFVADWKISYRAAGSALLGLLAVGAVFIGFAVEHIERHLAPWRMAYAASVASPVPQLVFLSGNRPVFTAKHENSNEANWKSAPTVFLNDPGANRRNEVACRFGRSPYRVVSYNESTGQAETQNFQAICPAP